MRKRDKYSLRKVIGVSVAKYLHEVFYRSKSSKLTSSKPNITNRTTLKTLWKRKVINKSFREPGILPLYSGVTITRPVELKMRSVNLRTFRVYPCRSRAKKFLEEVPQDPLFERRLEGLGSILISILLRWMKHCFAYSYQQ